MEDLHDYRCSSTGPQQVAQNGIITAQQRSTLLSNWDSKSPCEEIGTAGTFDCTLKLVYYRKLTRRNAHIVQEPIRNLWCCKITGKNYTCTT